MVIGRWGEGGGGGGGEKGGGGGGEGGGGGRVPKRVLIMLESTSESNTIKANCLGAFRACLG